MPEPWIDKIFGRMEAKYGSLFIDRWRNCNLVAVKAEWAAGLASFSDDPKCFHRSIDALTDDHPSFPPTLPEFIHLCRKHYQQPRPQQLAIEDKSRVITPEQDAKNRRRWAEVAQRLAASMTGKSLNNHSSNP